MKPRTAAMKPRTAGMKPRKSGMKSRTENRRAGLLKKVGELSTLCGVKACAVVYSGTDPVPATWPEDPSAVVDVICEYMRNMEASTMEAESMAVQLRRIYTINSENKEKIRRRRLQLLEREQPTPPPIVSPPPALIIDLDSPSPPSSPALIHSAPFIDPSAPFIDPSAPFIDPSAPFIDPSAPFIDPSAPFIDPSAPFIDPSPPSIDPSPPSIDPSPPSIDPSAPSPSLYLSPRNSPYFPEQWEFMGEGLY